MSGIRKNYIDKMQYKRIKKKISTMWRLFCRFVYLSGGFGLKTAFCIVVLPYMKSVQYKHEYMLQFLEQRYSDIIRKYRERSQAFSSLPLGSNIWICWFQGDTDMPETIKHSVQSIRRYANGLCVQMVTWENYSQFVSIPQCIIDKVMSKKISWTHFSDILRSNLLADYGGVWIDAALFLTDELQIPQLPFFTLKQKNKKNDHSFVSEYRWVVGYMGGVKGNILHTFMKDFLNAYYEREKTLIDYFLTDYVIALAYKTIPAVRKMVDDVPYSNEDFYYISNHLFSPVNEEEFKSILGKNRVFKLGYKNFPQKIDDNSLYAYLFREKQWRRKLCDTTTDRHLFVSVIVSIYNKEQYLHRCLNSILAQTFVDFELLLVDDGSKDKSVAICEEYAGKDNRVRVLKKRNGGVSSARNFGLKEAKGDWVVFVDADDYMDELYLESLLPQNGEDFVMDSSDDRSPHFVEGFYQGKGIFAVALSDWHMLCAWGKIFKRDIIRENGIKFEESICNGEDTLFNLKYLLHVVCLRVSPSQHYHYDNTVESSLSKQETPYEKALYKASRVYALGKEMAKKNNDESVSVLISKYAGITWGLWKNLVKYNYLQRVNLIKELFAMNDIRNLMKDYFHCKEAGKRYALFYFLCRCDFFKLAALIVR